ncbi:MAG TPA: hypothetical protein VGR09_04910 [Gemmatimonadales bacterium]|nr:hypothetical protein [Gemmatimonadales bacterium]
MTAVERYFFTPLYYPRSQWSILRWWESRRLLFNLSVGSVGLLSLGIVSLIGRAPPHPGGFPVPWDVVLVYGVLANLCYTLGPVGDLVLRRVLGDRAAAVGPVLFRYGFVFSLGLTLLPIPVAALGWLVSWLF